MNFHLIHSKYWKIASLWPILIWGYSKFVRSESAHGTETAWGLVTKWNLKPLKETWRQHVVLLKLKCYCRFHHQEVYQLSKMTQHRSLATKHALLASCRLRTYQPINMSTGQPTVWQMSSTATYEPNPSLPSNVDWNITGIYSELILWAVGSSRNKYWYSVF